MKENNKCLEVAIRLFDNYIDLWFKNELVDYMKEKRGGITSADLFFQFEIFKDDIIIHLTEDIKMNQLISINLIEHIVKEKHEEHLRALISSIS